jgi:hypothetical protein
MHTSIEIRRDEENRGWPRAKAHAAVAAFYLAVALLNGADLLRQAERLPFGRYREVCVALARPLAAASRATRLDRPRAALEAWAGRTLYDE